MSHRHEQLSVAGLTLEEAVLLAHRENVPVDARFDALGDDS